MEDAWGAAVRMVGTTSAVLGALQLLGSGAVLTLSMVNAGLRFSWPGAMQLFIELMTDLAAAGMMVGGIGVYRVRGWGRAATMWSMVAFIAISTVMLCFRVWRMFGGPSSFMTGLGAMGAALYLTYTMCVHMMDMLLPVLVVLILRRAEVRQRFMGQVVG